LGAVQPEEEESPIVVVQIHQLTAVLYLVAALVASLGLVLPAPRLGRAALVLLGVGAVSHALCFGAMHTGGSTPALTSLPAAVSFMAWVGTLFYLVLARRARLGGLVVLVAPLAFISVFVAGLRLPAVAPAVAPPGGSWEHAHVMLAGAGLALLCLAGVAAGFFLAEHRRLKSKRPIRARFPLPSLEALDQVNTVALAMGFPLLTLGVITGIFWVEQQSGRIWTNSPHEWSSAIAWAVYAAVVVARFARHQGARQAAASAVVGFLFLFFAVIGLEFFV
jgi:ABC-type transport system involved in cytochrome c biogenesis permease subunit